MADPQVIIGIDLGTTNCTLAFVPLDKEGQGAQQSIQFSIPQVIASGTEDKAVSLPSFLYLPLEAELKKKVVGVSWDVERSHAVGVHARERSQEVPDRVVTSAKSWLCHDGVDRRAPLLPLTMDNVEQRLSPLDTCAAFLTHLREAWNLEKPELPFVEQSILVTVPASFTPSARQLVQEAAEKAGYPASLVLLEEPQAAFYSWLQKHAESWREQLKVGDKVLVIDVGGGTTDFSLIAVSEEEGDLTLERLAVGDHLLLGGDNMDLALAHTQRLKIEEEKNKVLDDWQFHQLTHACRQAKELLMGEEAPESTEIAIQGRGSGLVGGTITCTLHKSEVQALLVEGFFPLVPHTECSVAEKHLGLQQLGLPYAQDARMSCQLAKFLTMTAENTEDNASKFTMPTHILFNGGAMKAATLQERVLSQLSQWADELGTVAPQILTGGDLDYSVSCGASYYGLARAGQAIRIKGGTSRSYYIGIEEARLAIPGLPPALTAVCVAPFGMEEGTEEVLEGRDFCLVLGQQATFRFFSTSSPKLSNGELAAVGTEVKRWKEELTELHPIETLLDQQEGEGQTVRVTLKSKVTELGVLELWCENSAGRRWKLEFDIRKEELASV